MKPSFGLLLVLVVTAASCQVGPVARSPTSDAFTLLAIPPAGVGKCEHGPFRGDFMEDEPPQGSIRIALEIGTLLSRGRSVRVIVDSAGRINSFRDELTYDSAGTSIARSIAVRFNPDGSVATGMDHHHETRGNMSSTAKDQALAPDRYAAVMEAARRLRQRCGVLQ